VVLEFGDAEYAEPAFIPPPFIGTLHSMGAACSKD
jgi:hypothetical protein